MNRIKLLTATLAEAYPGLVFGFEKLSPSHRNHHLNLRISWKGGPLPDAVETHLRQAVPDALKSQATRCWAGFKVGYCRTPTQAECDAHMAEWAAGRPQREAEAKARKAKAKLDGIAARAETLAEKKTLIATLAGGFPGVVFKVLRAPRGYLAVSWTGGPSEAEVCRVTGLRDHHVERAPDAAEIAAQEARIAKAARRAERQAATVKRKFEALKRMKKADGVDPTNATQVLDAYREVTRVKLWRKTARWLRRSRLFAPCAQREVTPDRRLRRQRRQAKRALRDRQLALPFLLVGVMLPALPLSRCKPRNHRR